MAVIHLAYSAPRTPGSTRRTRNYAAASQTSLSPSPTLSNDDRTLLDQLAIIRAHDPGAAEIVECMISHMYARTQPGFKGGN